MHFLPVLLPVCFSCKLDVSVVIAVIEKDNVAAWFGFKKLNDSKTVPTGGEEATYTIEDKLTNMGYGIAETVEHTDDKLRCTNECTLIMMSDSESDYDFI